MNKEEEMNISKKTKWIAIGVIGFVIVAFAIKFLYFSGRSSSRLAGKNFRQVIKVKNLPDAASVLSISFDKRGTETVKDVTFRAKDGYLYTKEFKDWSPLEGVIRWVPHGEGNDLIQSRALSRWVGDVVNLELPKDFKKLVNVDISYAADNVRTKNLVYLNVKGHLMAKEYREGLLNRHFGGYLEIQPR
ncbi:hypothetical protein ACQZV8_04985 [Magnetococcales bacterium HHB-1]